jgi:trimeric autotransporter adhesin
MIRARLPMLLLATVFAVGCGGSKHGSTVGIPGGGGTTGIPGGGNTTGTGTTPTVTLSADATVAKGLTHQFQAHLAHDGIVDDCTGTGQWTSSDPAVATVTGGAATTLGLGQTTITATCSGYSDTSLLVVTAAEVVSIAVTPLTGELPVGLSEQLAATATLTDGTTSDVTVDVVWASSNTNAFDVSNAVATAGVLLAKNAAGQSSTITAFHAVSGSLASVTRTVTSASVTLSSITVTATPVTPISGAFDPTAPSVPLGVDLQFHATGSFSDGASADVTPSVTWVSNNTTVASFTPPPGGFAATLGTGSAIVTASCAAAIPACSATPATTTLHVTPAVVTSVAIDQSGATFGIGESLQLTGTASFTDDSTQAVTLTGWTSSVPGVATVSDTGFLTAVAAGFATVSASYAADGQTFAATSQFEVVAPSSTAILSYLSLTPGSVKGGGRKPSVVVALTAPASEAITVTLASSNPTYVPVPASVTIPAGSSSVRFTITTSRPPSKTKVTIRATLGSATKTATLNLRR